MSSIRVALASVPLTQTVDAGLAHVLSSISEAARRGATIICFPEANLPGHRWNNPTVEHPTAAQIEHALSEISSAARSNRLTVVVGIVEPTGALPHVTQVVIDANGIVVGRQRKVQLAPVEDDWYSPGKERRVFEAGPLTFGISICHEGFRYPETVRAAARRGAQLVFHPFYEGSLEPTPAPTGFQAPGGTYHEHAIACRARENGIFIAACNYALPDQPAATCFIAPDGGLISFHPHGKPGLLVADLDLAQATAVLAKRFRPDAL